MTCNHPGHAYDYSSNGRANPKDHAVAAGNSIRQTHPDFSGANAVILHSSTPICWAHEESAGAMYAWGGVSANGGQASYCRSPGAKRFHVYVCK